MSLTSCIISPYYKDRNGYAYKTYKRKNYYHHRLVYMQHHNIDSKDMKGLVVMHLCDNPSCINIDHLRLATQLDNIRDRNNKGRQAKGINNSQSKITEADVIAIRSSHLTQKELAIKYGISRGNISQIKSRKLWKHL